MFPLSLTSRRPAAPAPVLQALLRLRATATAATFWPCADPSRRPAGWWSLNCRLKTVDNVVGYHPPISGLDYAIWSRGGEGPRLPPHSEARHRLRAYPNAPL